jgi:hypothetical protein
VLTHPEVTMASVKSRMEDILGGRYPRLPPRPKG